MALKIYTGSETLTIPTTTYLTGRKLRLYDGSQIVGIPLVDITDTMASGLRIYDGSAVKALLDGNYISLYSLRTGYSSFGAASWVTRVTDNAVSQTDSNFIYSTTSGNWLPSSTYTKTLKINVVGQYTQTGADPNVQCDFKFRVYYQAEVNVQTRIYGHTYTTSRINRTDTFQRVSATSININGSPQSITAGSYYTIQNVTWNPGDNGSGTATLRIYNTNTDYFDVYVYAHEYDEQGDTALIKVDCYCELV